jgi:hypothetical protein
MMRYLQIGQMWSFLEKNLFNLRITSMTSQLEGVTSKLKKWFLSLLKIPARKHLPKEKAHNQWEKSQSQ